MTTFILILFGLIYVFWIFPKTNKEDLKSCIQCPHCNTIGQVYTKNVTNKKGISGGKATGAILTGWLSILATGLSRKEEQTKLHCKKCDMIWFV